METFQTVCSRVSIREYQDKPVPEKFLLKLVDAARRAPSARHVEPWDFVVITARQMMMDIGACAPNGSFVKEAAACIAVFCRETKYYLEDGCAATENILLQAADLGLGACWIAGDKKDYAPQVARMLAVPDGFRLVSLVALGWPKQPAEQIKNRRLDEVIHWEKF